MNANWGVSMNSNLAVALVAATVAFSGDFARAAGFEKNIIWSGRYGGQGGAALSTVEGSEALYWNPAGLVSNRVGHDVSLNVSPTLANYQGSISTDGENRKSKEVMAFPFGLIYGATLNEKWGFGIGSYVSGGSAVKYENVPISVFTVRPEIKSDLQLVEIGAGVGYRVNEQWKIGAAWRVGLVNAKLSTASVSTAGGGTLTATQFTNLKSEEFAGFRVGAQYAPNENWGFGFSLRTAIDFEADGDGTGQVQTAAQVPSNSFTSLVGPASVKSSFPLQVSLGGHWNIEPGVWRAHAEYGFTQYGDLDQLEITTNFTGTPSTSTIKQDWKDQHHVRLAGEFLGTSWPVRFGYVFTSQVVPEDHARATFSAPGVGHTLTLGTGTDFMEDTLRFNVALEHSWIDGDVDNANPTAVGGKYESVGTSLHLGLAYMF